jgi:hypothetical protein
MSKIRFGLLASVAATIAAVATPAGQAMAQTRQFSCAGSLIAPTSVQSALSVRLNFSSSRAVAVDAGTGVVNAPVVSNNKVQLKFRTKQYVGEFFHYTNDLFLIYPSGHLARLTCSPG